MAINSHMTSKGAEPRWAGYRSDTVPLLGAHAVPGSGAGEVEFVAWSTTATELRVELYDAHGLPTRRDRLQVRGGGVFGGVLSDIQDGSLYRFVLDDRVLPDPYARSLPHGVHGPAQIARSGYVWQHPRPRSRTDVIYELHVGAFTAEGTFRAAALRLPMLADLGIDTIELMPLSSFAGRRGWGYDGVAHYAPYFEYGSPDDLRAFVDAAHGLGLRVILDVVYNHFGPAGNYLSAYSPEYFSHQIATPWGDGPNFANPFMRALVVRNGPYWLDEFMLDGLRLDALHQLRDPSPTHVLEDIVQASRAVYPGATMIGEDERNDRKLVKTVGLDSMWADDFHHQVSVLLTSEVEGYYSAYRPSVEDLARTIERGWLYEGQLYAPTGRPRGTPSDGLAPEVFVYCIENHDQVGNRAFGDRLSSRCSPEAFVSASMLLFFLPQRVLLFMGQEWGASSPFLYFTDHDPELGRLVSKGRREEFSQFSSFSDPELRERIPDPQSEDTFRTSKLVWDERGRVPHSSILSAYRALLSLRRSDPVLSAPDGQLSAEARAKQLVVYRRRQGRARALCWNLSSVPARLQVAPGLWSILAGSELGPEAQGPGSIPASGPIQILEAQPEATVEVLQPWRALLLASVEENR